MFIPYLRAICLVALTIAPEVHAQRMDPAVADLPLTEVPSATGQTLAIFWSGDGGWADLTKTISKELAANGVAVIGINSRAWLQKTTRSPDDAARDTERVLRTYLAKWSRTRVMLLGYSRGAGFTPFIVNRLPKDLHDRIELAAMLGAERSASFEFHLIDLVKTTARPTDLAVVPEIQRSTGVRWFCLYGKSEDDTICPTLDPAHTTIVARDGGHHFDENYPAMAQDILHALPARP